MLNGGLLVLNHQTPELEVDSKIAFVRLRFKHYSFVSGIRLSRRCVSFRVPSTPLPKPRLW